MNRICLGIVTHNRREDCLRAVRSAHAQTIPCRVILYDNASEDGVSDAVLAEFPETEVIRGLENQGVTVGRNRILERVDSDTCFFLDNDAEFIDPRTLDQSIAILGQRPRVAIVGLTIIERQGVHWGSDEVTEVRPVRSYHGAGHLVRVAALQEVGGYSESVFAYNEESDLCMRLFEAGWLAVHGAGCAVYHHKNPNRDVEARQILRWRNETLFKWQYCPWEFLAPAMLQQARQVVRSRGVTGGLAASGMVLKGALAVRRNFPRRPVSRDAYRLWRRLARVGSISLDQAIELAERIRPDLPSGPEDGFGVAAA